MGPLPISKIVRSSSAVITRFEPIHRNKPGEKVRSSTPYFEYRNATGSHGGGCHPLLLLALAGDAVTVGLVPDDLDLAGLGPPAQHRRDPVGAVELLVVLLQQLQDLT